jgi:hypothetical protein
MGFIQLALTVSRSRHLAPCDDAIRRGRAVVSPTVHANCRRSRVGVGSRGIKNRQDSYLNVTPPEGDEQLKGFARFRVHLIGKDDDRDVHLDSSAGNLAFRGGTGSCVIDDYLTRVGDNHYREIACFVVGQHVSSVLVAAGANANWTHFLPLLRESVASFRIS